MKSKIWILIILILFIITYIYFSNLNENYIEKRKIDYIVGEKGEIQVIQEDIYNVKDYISNINTYLLLPLKDIPIDLEKNSLKFQKLTDVSIEIIDSNNKKIDNNIPSYSNVDRKIYASTYLKEGRYKVITKYTIHNTLTNYDDVCELYTKVLSDKEKIKARNNSAEAEIVEVINKVKRRVTGNHMRHKMPMFAARISYSMYGNQSKTSHFVLEDSCVGCGYCAKKCPANAIEMKENKPVWVKKQCIMCLGCLHRCPKFAIQYGKNTKKHGQYLNPNTKV